jgi:hypothetical protein
MEICTCHFRENLEWLSEWPVTVVHKEGGGPVPATFHPVYTIPNVGCEATAYLWYIIQRYDSLPDRVAFIHGHEEACHQLGDRPLLEMIRGANKERGLVHLNNAWRCVTSIKQVAHFAPFLDELGIIDFVPEYFITCCGAQFVVARENILRNSKSLYQKLYSMIQTQDHAICMEVCVWNFLFCHTFSVVPRDDDFSPPLKTIRYHTSGSCTMNPATMRFVYRGRDPPDPSLACISTKEDYDASKNTGCVMMTCFGDDPVYECDDPGRILWIVRDEFERMKQRILITNNHFYKVFMQSIENSSRA